MGFIIGKGEKSFCGTLWRLILRRAIDEYWERFEKKAKK